MQSTQKLFVALALVLLVVVPLAVTLTSTAGPGCTSDIDLDGICDVPGLDNCTTISNPLQRDDDEDGYGNLCDGDPGQDCKVGAPDIAAGYFRLASAVPWLPKNLGAYDINEDGLVGVPDLFQTSLNSYSAPGPSSRACADCTAPATAGLGLGVCP